MIRREEVERLREEYPVGTRVVLDRMDDAQAPPVGTKGTVSAVDDCGTVHVRWDNGSGLGCIPGEDEFHSDEEEARAILEAVAACQKDGVNCPRCGMPMEGKLMRNALSRRLPIMVCEICGTEEAFEDAGWNERRPFSKWKAVLAAWEGGGHR